MAEQNIETLQARLETLRSLQNTEREKAEVLISLVSSEFRNNPEKAVEYAREALLYSQQTGSIELIAESHHMCSLTSWITGKFSDALESSRKSILLLGKTDNRLSLARAYNNAGNIYRDLGDFPTALKYFFKSLRINEEEEASKGIAFSLLNIGNTHKDQGRMIQAEEHYVKSLELFKTLGSQLNIVNCYNNIGIVKAKAGKLDQAAEYHKKALEIRIEINDTRGIANSCGNLGTVLEAQGKYKQALEYHSKALRLGENLAAQRTIVVSCFNIGSIHTTLGDWQLASDFLQRAIEVADKMGSRDLQASGMSYMAEFHQAQNEFEQAFLFERKHREIREDLFNEESRNKIAMLHVKFETDKKQREAECRQLKNLDLKKEIKERKVIEEELKRHQNHLEDLVKERTAELLKLNEGLEKSFKGTVFTISKLVEEREPYSSGHQVRTAELARAMAKDLGLKEDRIDSIYLAAVVHDIGKIRVPQEFLSRSGILSKIELSLVRAYPQAGYDILKTIEFPWAIAEIVLQHHEFINGSGYPSGLKGDEIMLEARILCVADVVEAMSSRRPYRPAFSLESTLKELSDNRGILYDSECVDACIRVVEEGQFTPRKDSARIRI